MTFWKLDDQEHGTTEARMAGLPALGLRYVAASWSMAPANLTDGFIPAWFVETWPSGKRHAAQLCNAGYWLPTERELNGQVQKGWQDLRWHDQERAEDVMARRRADAARQKVNRNPRLRADVRERDQDMCRYCGVKVSFNRDEGRRYERTTGTVDHVDPAGPDTDPDNLVVACRGCNSRKGRRTPAEAGMTLRPAPVPKPRSGTSSSRPLHCADCGTPIPAGRVRCDEHTRALAERGGMGRPAPVRTDIASDVRADIASDVRPDVHADAQGESKVPTR